MPFKDLKTKVAKQKEYSHNWNKANRPKKRQRYNKWYWENRDYVRAKARVRYFKKKYGLTLEDIEKMAVSQNHRCKICNKRKPLHDHFTNEIRGLLCNGCNRKLGMYEKWKREGRFDNYLREDRRMSAKIKRC